MPPLLSTHDTIASIAPLTTAAAATGFVDYLPNSDGVVRTMPLWVSYRGKAYPQAGLSLACMMLGIGPADPRQVRIADNAVTLRTTLKAIAQLHGLYATFMPKPFHGINGNGMHTHQSLWSCDGKTNLFHDANDEYQLSPTARSFMAGLLAHAKGMIAILAPLVNSYKRLVPGYEAPVYISWARINRSALIRIPQASRGRPEATRLELRCPDPSCNPYLAFSAMLAAGLDGINRKLELAKPVEENLYHFDDTMIRKQGVQTLPGSLEEALNELAADEVIQSALGAHVCEWFLEAKRAEWNDYRIRVTPWELERYLMTY